MTNNLTIKWVFVTDVSFLATRAESSTLVPALKMDKRVPEGKTLQTD